MAGRRGGLHARECRKRVEIIALSEAPEAGLGELDRVAGGVADVDRAGADPGQRKSASMAMPAAARRCAPVVELGGGGGEGEVAGAAGAVGRDREGGVGAAGARSRRG